MPAFFFKFIKTARNLCETTSRTIVQQFHNITGAQDDKNLVRLGQFRLG